jgi:hypothetical protein
MTDRTIDVLRHHVDDLAGLDCYNGPDTDILGTETVLTVVCGEVVGEIDRVVSRAADGALVMVFEARVDGLSQGTGVAKVESNSAVELMCLAQVAKFLAGEMAKLAAQQSNC